MKEKLELAYKLIETKTVRHLCNALTMSHILVTEKMPIDSWMDAWEKALKVWSEKYLSIEDGRYELLETIYPAIHADIENRLMENGKRNYTFETRFFNELKYDELRVYRLDLLKKYM